MANTATNINELISSYQDGFTDKELLRMSNDGTYTMFLDDSALIGRGGGIISPDSLNDVKNGAYSPDGAAIPILKNAGVVVNSTPITLCNATAINGDTVRLAVTYQDVSFSIKQYYGSNDYNLVGRQAEIMRKLKEATKTVRTTLATACENALDTNKNQQQVTPYLFNYFTDSLANEFQVDPAVKDFMYNKLHGQFDRMDFSDVQKRIVGNPEAYATARELYAQGGANNENTQFQFRGDVSPEFIAEEGFNTDTIYYRDNVILNGASVQETFYAVPTGSVAIVHANNIARYSLGKLANGTDLTTQRLPGLDAIDWGMKYSVGCDDNDLEYEQWGFESRYAIFTPYVENLLTDLTGINKYIVKP